MRYHLLLVFAVLFITGCGPRLPPSWAEGGARLLIQPATWDRGDSKVSIAADGHVSEDGDVIFMVDRVGRVVDEDYEPVAILLPDGFVAGIDGRLLGRIGLSNASPPTRPTAWIAVLPDGQVIHFDHDGERKPWGVWRGCNGPALRTCTLVSHVMALRRFGAGGAYSGVGLSIGVGVVIAP